VKTQSRLFSYDKCEITKSRDENKKAMVRVCVTARLSRWPHPTIFGY